jgi:hypothetical protein
MSYTSPTVVASGTTFTQLQQGGLSAHIEKLITAQAATLAPTAAATTAETGSGGTLTAATYYVVITESNGFGETTASPVSAGTAITSTGELVVTFPTLKSGNTSRNTYIGTASGGPFTLAATGTTAATLTILAPPPTNSFAVAPPTVNTTGLTYTDGNGNVLNKPLALLRGAKDGNLEDAYKYAREVVTDFNRGEPVTFNGMMMKFRHAHAVFAMLATVFAEAGVLLDANAGTLGLGTNGIGETKTKRTWP